MVDLKLNINQNGGPKIKMAELKIVNLKLQMADL